MKIAILGNSGSGKSTLASALAAAHDLCVLDLDTIAWEPGKVAVARDPVLAASDVEAFCQRGEHWVVEGCYGRLRAGSARLNTQRPKISGLAAV